MNNVLLIGKRGGVGQACISLLSDKGYQVTGLDSTELDLNYPERVFDLDLSNFDILINCAGHSRGTYQGFFKNSWENQVSQINVNYVSNIFLLKHFANSRSQGKYVWISSAAIRNSRSSHSTYVGAKIASKATIDMVRSECPHIDILEINVGIIKNNFRYINFNGSKTHEEVEESYIDNPYVESDYVAKQLVSAMEANLKEIVL